MPDDPLVPEGARGKVLPKVIFPEVELPPRKKSRFSVPLWLGIVAVILVLAVAGLFLFTAFKETSVVFRVSPGDLQISDSPLIVHNFSDKVQLLRKDYNRLLEQTHADYASLQSSLRAANADLAGRQEKLRLFQEEQERLKQELADLVANPSQLQDDDANKEGEALDKELEGTKEVYQQKLEVRAKELGIAYVRDAAMDSLDVSVNAFKLALYQAPPNVKAEEERQFADKLLTDWQKYQDAWEKKEDALKEKIQLVRQQLPSNLKIEETKTRIAEMQSNIQAIKEEIRSFQTEAKQYDIEQAVLKNQIDQTTNRFMGDLLEIPQEFIKRKLALGSNGLIELRNLQKQPKEFPPGDYLILVTATKDNAPYWALKKFSIKAFCRNTYAVERNDFVLARSYLTGETAEQAEPQEQVRTEESKEPEPNSN